MRRLALHPILPVLAFLLLALSIPVTGRAADAIDRSDPVATATAFLRGYALKDLDVMTETMNPELSGMLQEVKTQGPTHRGYGEMFGGWRHAAAVGWDGTFGEARTKTFAGSDDTYHMLPFHTSPEGWIGVLMLKKDAGGWYVDDIEKWEADTYGENPLAGK